MPLLCSPVSKIRTTKKLFESKIAHHCDSPWDLTPEVGWLPGTQPHLGSSLSQPLSQAAAKGSGADDGDGKLLRLHVLGQAGISVWPAGQHGVV